MNATMTDLKVPNPEMFDNYDTGGWTPPPQAKQIGPNGKPEYIKYTLTAPSADKFSWPETKKDGSRYEYLTLVVDGFETDTLDSGGKGSVYTLRQEYLSSRPFGKYDRAGNRIGHKNASQLGNYFRAHGLNVRPGTVDEYKSYAEATANRQFQATLDWEAYDSERQTTVAQGWDAFPDDPEKPGQKLPYIEDGDKRFWARASVKRYVDAVGGA